jgi:hypothetical protein
MSLPETPQDVPTNAIDLALVCGLTITQQHRRNLRDVLRREESLDFLKQV